MDSNILVIPRYSVFMTFIDIPSLDESEIEKIAELQAIKETPYQKNEVVAGYRNLGSYKSGFSSVMLVIASKDMIQAKIQERSRLDIETDNIRLYTELLYLYLVKKEIVSRDKITFVVHIGREDSEIIVISGGRPVFSRGFKNSEKFLEEIDRSVLAYERNRDNLAIDDVVITYASDIDMSEAASYIEDHFAVPITFHEYKESEDLLSSDLLPTVDLLPKEFGHKKKILQQRYQSMLTVSLIGFIALLFLTFPIFKLYERNRFLKMLSTRVEDMQSRVEKLDVCLKKTEIAKGHIDKGAFIAGLLEGLHVSVPNDISTSGLDYDGKNILFYKGTARDMPAILAFAKKLEGSEYFVKAEVKYAAKKKVKGREFTDFDIQCELKQ